MTGEKTSMRILFQGDSVTEADRDKNNPDDLGPGYALTASNRIREMRPDMEFTFFNRGISGNRAVDLYHRFQKDFLDLKPDLVTILVGVNDSMHRTNDVYRFSSNDSFRYYYESILKELKSRNIKIVMLEPFCLPNPDLHSFRFDLIPKIDIVRMLASEYADRFVLLDGPLFQDALENGLHHLTNDGVHPNAAGRVWLGEKVAEAVLSVLR